MRPGFASRWTIRSRRCETRPVVTMNALKANDSLIKLFFTASVLFCLNSARAHPGHAHDGGASHVALHGAGWLGGVALVSALLWLVRRRMSLPVATED